METTKVWKVTKEDLSHLGGPMGSEYTTTILTKLFSEKEKAIEWIKKDMKKEKREEHFEKPTSRNKSLKTSIHLYWDCLHVGYSLDKDKVEIE
jgi:hypothetical protein